MLTRFINPAQPIQSKNHRSYVVLQEEDTDDKGKKIYRFYYEGDEEKRMLWANHRYLKVEKEGKPELLFGGPGEARAVGFQEPRIKWGNSKARRLLVDDVNDGNIEFGDDDKPVMPIKDIFAMHPEYADYDYERFEERLLSIWEKCKAEMDRAAEDLAAFEEFMEYNEVKLFNRQGTIQWQGSEAQQQALVDLAENNIGEFGYQHVFQSNEVYHENFTYGLWKEYIKQEIRTEKYLHTVKVRDLQKKQKREKKHQRQQKTNDNNTV